MDPTRGLMEELAGPSSCRVIGVEDPHPTLIFFMVLVGPMESGLQCPDFPSGFLLREWRRLSPVGSSQPWEPGDHLAAGCLGREALPSSLSPTGGWMITQWGAAGGWGGGRRVESMDWHG